MSANTVPFPLAHRRPAAEPDFAILALDRFDFANPAGPLELGPGWGLPEATMRWTLGPHSACSVTLPIAADPDRRVLGIIEGTPYLGGNPLAAQRFVVRVNGEPHCETVLNRPGRLAFFVPPDALGRPLAISLDCPDAISPASLGQGDDRRELGLGCTSLQFWSLPAIPRRIPPLPEAASATDAQIMEAFESLGDNCEFGIAQRLSGCEPLGLLRFTATPLASLTDLLLHEAAGIGDPAHITLDLRGTPAEYILTEQRYGLTYHTFSYADQLTPARVQHREAQKLTLLRRRMLDDLRSGRRIYVIKYNAELRDADIAALYLQLRGFGPNRLLHVTLADQHHPPGTIDLLAPGLARGYIDRFAPYDNAADVSLSGWVTLCRNAERVFAS